ncbi:MAG: 2-succinyl-6-hydroxy-2,4-cyclohexadiene-1-carboxylate synthase, partial [Candidatus Zixiibacteriota bacterium]
FLQTCQYDEYILISDYRHKDSPELKVTCRINNDIAAFTDKLCPKLVPCEHERLHILKLANMTAREFILRETSIEKRITQPGAAYLTMHLTDINSALFLASSLPIRDMDSFGPICERPMPVGANRGASGIDGTVASASGFAVGHKKPVTLLIGDLALLHDINSLALLKDNPSPVTVVVVNNGGGNIFQRLPVARCEDIFEKYFLTPHPFDFEKAAAMFGLNYYHPESVEELIKALEKRAVNENSTLIEIKIDAAQNQKNYDKLLIKFAERLDKISRLGNDACRFGYITSGSPEKPAVLLLHGFMGDKSDWRDIVPHLENDFYIVAVDLPGHGETFVNGPEDFYSMPNTARAIVHFLESNEISKTHLLGYSMGGRLGHYLLFAFPGYFEKAVLESSSPGYEVIGDMRKRIIDDDALAERLNHEDFRQFLEYWYGQPLFEGIKNDPERFERLLQKRLKNQPGELARSLRYMGTGMMPSLWANLKKIKNQILFIAGGNDDRYKKIAEEMSDLCPYGEVCIIKDCGHNVHFEKPREYAEQVKQFLLR